MAEAAVGPERRHDRVDGTAGFDTASLSRSLERAISERGPETALVEGDQRQTWSGLGERIRRLANGFARLGLAPGGRVVLLSLNSHRSIETFFAALWAGGAVVPLNHRLSARELTERVADCSPAVIVLGPEFEALGPNLADAAGEAALVHCDGPGAPGTAVSYEDLIASSPPVEDAGRSGGDLAMILYTSGTTGSPKGVMLSHANIAANTANTIGPVGLGGDSVHLHHGPLFHVAAAARIFSVTEAGGMHVMLPRFGAREVVEIIEREGVTHATFVPTMIRALLDEPALAAMGLPSLRLISYGAAPMPRSLLGEMMAVLPHVGFLQSYGMTELSPVVTILSADDHRSGSHRSGILRSAGRRVPLSQVLVVDPEDKPLPQGAVGEIIATGPNVMLGYWKRPDLSAEALRGGWMHTGDAGYFDDNGYLYVVDRIKDMIITGGENVFSQEVENVIATHPDVAECAVVGVPDPHWGETVHAVVRLRHGSITEPGEIIAHCRARLAHFKCPQQIHLRGDPMPLSGANKILKTKLREELESRQPQP